MSAASMFILMVDRQNMHAAPNLRFIFSRGCSQVGNAAENVVPANSTPQLGVPACDQCYLSTSGMSKSECKFACCLAQVI